MVIFLLVLTELACIFMRKLLQKWEMTGCPVLINTSFNVRSEPIVCTPEDALRGFMMTEMDVLVLGRHIVIKSEQKKQVTEETREKHLSQFKLD